MARKRIRKSAINLYEDLDHIKASLAAITKDVRSKAAEMLSNSIENAKDKTYEVSDDVEEYIGSRPYQTIGTALLVGVVLGFLLRHKD
jgi:ElaB/YqjD/DUF883 family membrane-anchored ribosome-binding protein